MKKITVTVLSSLTVLSLTVPQVQALTIVRTFVGGTPTSNGAGGGNLVDIFNAAADWWEMAILDNHILTIDYGWANLAPNVLGVTSNINPNVRPTSANISFTNDVSIPWFLDPTPHENEEYQTYTATQQDLGGGLINVGRVYTNPIGAAVDRFDLLSVAKHEIGHALGFYSGNPNFTTPMITTTAPRPNVGTVIPTTNGGGGHIVLPNVLLQETIGDNIRRVQSGVDILAVGEVNNFQNLNLNPVHTPEPTATPLALGLVLGMGTLLRRKCSKP